MLMIARRSKAQVFMDILAAVQRKDGRIKKTHIMYDANLTHDRLESYLKTLTGNGFIESKKVGKDTFFSLTRKGAEYLAEMRRLKEMSEAFGIPV
jgi:predicted transcriptional regulator